MTLSHLAERDRFKPVLQENSEFEAKATNGATMKSKLQMSTEAEYISQRIGGLELITKMVRGEA